MCIFSAGHCRKICWAWTNMLIDICWQKQWSHPVKVECFTLKPTYENTVCWFFFTTVNSWCKQVSFLKETQCLDLLTSSCNRTPKFIMCCMRMPLMTQRIISSHNHLYGRFSYLECSFSVLWHCREIRWLWICQFQSTGTNSILTTNAKMFQSQNHSKTLCVLICFSLK